MKKHDSEGRSPLVLIFGILLIGLAIVVLFYGADFLNSLTGDSQESLSETDGTVLDQAGALPEVETGSQSVPGDSSQDNGLDIGDVAHDFELVDLDGSLVRLSDFRGQPVIVNFWATWCAPCQLEMPEFQTAFEGHQEDGLVILALNQDEPVDRAREFFYDEMGLTFTPLLDDGSTVYTSYTNFSVLPTTFFIDREGIVTGVHRGPLTESLIAGYLNEM